MSDETFMFFTFMASVAGICGIIVVFGAIKLWKERTKP